MMIWIASSSSHWDVCSTYCINDQVEISGLILLRVNSVMNNMHNQNAIDKMQK